MRVVTWNVNAVQPRLPRMLPWLAEVKPDVVALQEIKVDTADFPVAELEAAGYEVAAHGLGRWNGVALLSRVGLDDVVRDLPAQPGYDGVVEARAIGATCGGARFWSVYVPNGREPGHAHYDYKLLWLTELRALVAAELAAAPQRPWAVMGDFNVAPTDADVWDIAAFAGATHVTPQERLAFQQVLDAGLADVPARALKGAPFTFWDYRAGNFHKGLGMRIDFVLGNAPFCAAVTDAYVDREARKTGKAGTPPPSDHAPLVVDTSL